jgi:hypothetical protein
VGCWEYSAQCVEDSERFRLDTYLDVEPNVISYTEYAGYDARCRNMGTEEEEFSPEMGA